MLQTHKTGIHASLAVACFIFVFPALPGHTEEPYVAEQMAEWSAEQWAQIAFEQAELAEAHWQKLISQERAAAEEFKRQQQKEVHIHYRYADSPGFDEFKIDLAVNLCEVEGLRDTLVPWIEASMLSLNNHHRFAGPHYLESLPGTFITGSLRQYAYLAGRLEFTIDPRLIDWENPPQLVGFLHVEYLRGLTRCGDLASIKLALNSLREKLRTSEGFELSFYQGAIPAIYLEADQADLAFEYMKKSGVEVTAVSTDMWRAGAEVVLVKSDRQGLADWLDLVPSGGSTEESQRILSHSPFDRYLASGFSRLGKIDEAIDLAQRIDRPDDRILAYRWIAQGSHEHGGAATVDRILQRMLQEAEPGFELEWIGSTGVIESVGQAMCSTRRWDLLADTWDRHSNPEFRARLAAVIAEAKAQDN